MGCEQRGGERRNATALNLPINSKPFLLFVPAVRNYRHCKRTLKLVRQLRAYPMRGRMRGVRLRVFNVVAISLVVLRWIGDVVGAEHSER